MTTPASPSMTLLVELERFRSRALRVTFVRYAITAAAAALIAVAAAVPLIRPSTGTQLMLLLTAIVSGLVCAAAASFVKRPGLRQTAALVDRRCDLHDCLTAAVQFADGTDPMSQLVVEQARARLASLTLAEAFPYEWRLHSRTLSAAAIGAALVIAGVGVGSFPGWPSVPIVGGGSMAPAEPDRGDASATQTADSQARTNTVVNGGARVGAERLNPASASPQTPTTATAPAGSSSETSDSAQPTSEGERTPPMADRELVNAAGATGSANAAANSRRPDNNPSVGASSTEQRGGSGAGAGRDLRSSTEASGGVTAGQVTDAADAAGRRRQLSNDYASRYRDAVGRAEEALAREQVPAELRDAVRAYFTAIRP